MNNYILTLETFVSEEAQANSLGSMAREIAKMSNAKDAMELAKKSRVKVNKNGTNVFAFNDQNMTIIYDEMFNSLYIFVQGISSKKEKVLSVFKGKQEFKTNDSGLMDTAKSYIEKVYRNL